MGPSDTSIQHRYQALRRLIRDRKYADATELCETLLKERPDALWLRRRYADLLLKSGDTHRAGRVLQSLVTEYPDDPRVLGLCGERHRLEGRLEAARDYYEASLKRREDGYYRVRLADALIALNRADEAERVIAAGLTQHPNDPYLLRRKARLLAARGEHQAAAAIFEQAASLSGASAKDYADAIALKVQGLPPAVRRREVEALLSVPPHDHNPHLHALAAELAIEDGDPGAARAHLKSAEAHAAHDPRALKHIGYLYNRLGAYDKVVTTLGRAFVEDPRDIVAQQVLLAAARKGGAWPALKRFLLLAYDRHPGFHKLNGLIKKVDKELMRGRT